MTPDPADLVCVTDETEPLFWIKKSQYDALSKGFTHVTGTPGEKPIMQVISCQKILPASGVPKIAEGEGVTTQISIPWAIVAIVAIIGVILIAYYFITPEPVIPRLSAPLCSTQTAAILPNYRFAAFITGGSLIAISCIVGIHKFITGDS